MRGSTHIVSPTQHSPGWDEQGAELSSVLQSPGSQDLWDIHREAIFLELSISGLLGTQCSFPELPYNYVAPLNITVCFSGHKVACSQRKTHRKQRVKLEKCL